nr:hypothetical protein [uncultured Sulfurimonas sp.]
MLEINEKQTNSLDLNIDTKSDKSISKAKKLKIDDLKKNVSEDDEESEVDVDSLNTEAKDESMLSSHETIKANFLQKDSSFNIGNGENEDEETKAKNKKYSFLNQNDNNSVFSYINEELRRYRDIDIKSDSKNFKTQAYASEGVANKTTNLYVKDSESNLVNISEKDLLESDANSVNISEFLNNDTILIAYTIDNSQTMTLSDLIDFTTILHPEMFSIQELPLIPLGSDMSSMVDINSMMSGMMSMFMGSDMNEDMMNSFMSMMENFMGGMNDMPVDEFMSMMQGMMDIMGDESMMADASAMSEAMMEMMLGSMSMIPMESFSAMMTQMMESFPQTLANSQNPLEDMASAMGTMMLTFMADMNGTTDENAIAEFGSSMGQMVNQIMISMSGGAQDPSSAIGTMMGEMMASMMNTMNSGAILSMNSFSTMLSDMMNEFMGDMAGMQEMLSGMGDFEAIIAGMQVASDALPSLEDILPSNLYVEMPDGSLVNVRETDLLSADSMSVDITEFLGGTQLLVGYTIPSAGMMSVSDIMNLTTLTQNELLTLGQLPIFTLDSGDASMLDMSGMLTQMMSMFTNMGDENTSEAFMSMMENFMGGMDMPTDELMGMMQEMMSMMSGSTDMMIEMPEAMMNMMQESMSAMPLEEFSSMMSMMMQTFTSEMLSSDDPMVDMSNTMGAMMYEFMNGMTGGESETPAQDFALSMGEMVNQFMVSMTGGNEDPAGAMGDMMGSMMSAMMSGMTGMSLGEGQNAIDSFSNIMNDMMNNFMSEMANSAQTMLDPMTQMLNTMMSGVNGSMEMFYMMFESMNEDAQNMIEMSPQLMTMMLGMSDQIGAMADEINNFGDSIVDTQVVMSSNFLLTQQNASELIEMLTQNQASIEEAMGSEAFAQMLSNIGSVTTSMTALSDMGKVFPSNLFTQNSDGELAAISEENFFSEDGTSVDISSFLNGENILAAYTIPTTSQMTLGNLLEMTTMMESSTFSMQELPMIPTDGGMISVEDMSAMMNSMMGMFMGGQFISEDGTPLDMDAMQNMMGSMINPEMMQNMVEPFMGMMESFMSGMDMDAMMPMMSEMMNSMLDTGMMDSMAGMMDTMMEMMSTSMSAMPIAQFGDMMGVMMDTFTEEFTSSEDPFENMANTMGSMMYEFMNGMTGNESEQPAQEFALTMGEMVNQFMVGLTGGNEDPAQAMGDMMGSMMGSMMAGMTGNSEAPLESFTTSMSDMMGSFMTNMSNSMVTVMDPMTDMMNTMMSGMDANMAIITSIFEQANDTAGLMIEQSPLYMETILRLSDDIGLMADRIGDMADNIVDTQVIQSSNFLTTQDNTLELIEMLTSQESMLTDMMGAESFASMMENLQGSADMLGTLMQEPQSMLQDMASMLYVVDADGVMSQISEAELMDAMQNSVSIEEFLNGSELLVGYTIQNTPNMTLGDMMNYTSIIEDGFSMENLPMFSLGESGNDSSIADMSAMMNSMMGMFLGAQNASGDTISMDAMMDPSAMQALMPTDMMNPEMMEPFMNMMNSFMSNMDMPMEEFNTMMQGMMESMMSSGMMDSMAGMMDTMMEMMSTSMSAMPIEAFGEMMGVMMDTFTEEFTSSEDPFENMANTMGSMMYEFMNGMTGNESEQPAQEFALTMGEMINQFMVGLTGGNEDPAQAMGDMMGSMMGSMMAGMTGNSDAPLESFTTSMSDMMGSFMTNMSNSMVTVMDPMTDMMNTMMSGMDANMAIIASMFEQANDTAGLMIEQSPLYMETILRLSDDIGLMADRIGDMADNIVDTQVIQSSNFLATQDNALELIEMLTSQESMLSEMMGADGFASMMENLQGSADILGSFTSMGEVFPSNLFVQDMSGEISQVLESDLLNEDGSSVDISQMLSGNTMLVGYTIPNAEIMNIGSLLELTTLIDGGTLSLQDLPMIPTDDGSMISINEMSSMMNTMMGMFLGSQLSDADSSSAMDMDSMQNMMDPFMDMMGSFMGGMNMDSMMPMMSGMMETMMGMMNNSDMMDSMAGMSASMMDMMSTSMSAMPIDSFGSMAGTLMDTFTKEILLDGNPMDNMANTMGSMMYEFMNGMTGNDSEAPPQEFALTMGEMINQFMVGVTGGNEDPASEMGSMMGSMMSGMMAGMTGDHDAPLDSFTTTMSNMMGTFMNDMATSVATVMTPMDSMLNTFINGMDGNMVFIESMFNTANDTALSLIEQSPEYMTTILALSDDIGEMADRINEMADRIMETQVIQSENFLATQDNTLKLIEMLMADEARFVEELGADSFNAMMDNLFSAKDSMDNLSSKADVSVDDIFASALYMQMEDGSLVKVDEADLELEDGSMDISEMLNGSQLLVGYTIPNAENMNLAELINATSMIQNSGMSMNSLPMFSLSGGDASVMDMSSMMESMMGMFMGSGMTSTDSMNPDMIAPFMDMMENFMGGMGEDMPMDEFSVMMSGMMDSMMSSGMTSSMMDMSDSMMSMMSGSMSAMPMDSFSYMMSSMMGSFDDVFASGDTPMDAMVHTMGSMMLSFMEGMTGTDGTESATEFARTMGEMMNQFMVGVTGVEEDSAAAMGDMMGSMMGSFMVSVTGDSENAMESFANSMSNMMGSMMTDMSESAAIVMTPMADMMNTFLIGIDANMEFIASMFDTANGTMQAMIEQSPAYMETILRLSDDIGLMADRIDDMADKIVDTIELQSTNYELTQANVLELMAMLEANAPEYEALLGDSFATMMSNLGKIESSMGGIEYRIEQDTMSNFQEQMQESDSMFDMMGQTMGSMMMSFMEGMTEISGDETPEVFAQNMGEMMREFMIGVTGSSEEPSAAMGEMMGSMMGSFMSSMTANDETPMTEFTNVMNDMMHSLSEDMTSSMLTMIDPTTELMNTVVKGINGNMDLMAAMFDSANGTLQALIEQSPLYLDTMLRLSDDIGLMADRINDMADKIVDTQVILSDTFLTTQINTLEVMDSITAEADFLRASMGDEAFEEMMANFNSLTSAMDGVVESTAVAFTDVATEQLPIVSLESMEASEFDMTEMMSSMMKMMMGQNMNIPIDELVSEEFMSMMDSFANGMGLEVDTFMMMMNEMMDTMMINDMMTSMMNMAEEMLVEMNFSMGGVEVNTLENMMSVMMDTFMADGSPLATMADMMGSMMMSMMAEITPGENDTIDDMAYQMGSMMKSFFVGVTGDDTAPTMAMGDMMGSMVQTFMSSVTGDGEDFATIMENMMQSFMSDMGTAMMAISEPMMDSINTLLNGMDANMESISSMMDSLNDTANLALSFTPEYMSAMVSLSDDIMEMAGRVSEMMEKVDASKDIQLQNMMATQDNLIAMIEEMSTNEAFDEIVQKLVDAKNAIINLEVSVALFDIEMQEGIMNVTDSQENELFSISSFDSATPWAFSADGSIIGERAELHEHDFGFSGGDTLVVEFENSVSDASFDIGLTNYTTVYAYDSNQNRIELNSSNFSVDNSRAPATVTLNGLSDLRYIAVGAEVGSSFVLSMNNMGDMIVHDIPTALTYSVSLNQESDEELVVPVSVNNIITDITIPQGETSVNFTLYVEDDLLSQGLDSVNIALEMPSDDAIYKLDEENYEVVSSISDLSVEEHMLDVSAQSIESYELFSLIEEDITLLDFTNSLEDNIIIDADSIFNDNAEEELNSMLSIIGDESDSITIKESEWEETLPDVSDGFREYALVQDRTVILKIEDDLTLLSV